MSFSEIYRKIDELPSYKMEKFCEDCLLVSKNCIKYNKDDKSSTIYIWGKQLDDLIKETLTNFGVKTFPQINTIPQIKESEKIKSIKEKKTKIIKKKYSDNINLKNNNNNNSENDFFYDDNEIASNNKYMKINKSEDNTLYRDNIKIKKKLKYNTQYEKKLKNKKKYLKLKQREKIEEKCSKKKSKFYKIYH